MRWGNATPEDMDQHVSELWVLGVVHALLFLIPDGGVLIARQDITAL
jgi:hypothetical protein